MSDPTTEDGRDGEDREFTSLTVSYEFRDKVRVAKAKEGLSYEDYLRQHVPIE